MAAGVVRLLRVAEPGGEVDRGPTGLVIGGDGPGDRLLPSADGSQLAGDELVEGLLDLRRKTAGHGPDYGPIGTSLGSERIKSREIIREDDSAVLALTDDLGLHRLHLTPAGGLQRLLGIRERKQRLQMLDRRKDKGELVPPVHVESSLGREPAGIDGLAAVRPGWRVRRRKRQVEAVSKRTGTIRG